VEKLTKPAKRVIITMVTRVLLKMLGGKEINFASILKEKR
jgi:hypothetical protein